MLTIKTILEEMNTTVKQGQIMSPDWWLDKAGQLVALWQELQDEMTKYEMAYKSEIADKIEEGDSVAKATLVTEAKSNNYKMYRYLKGRDKTIQEMVRVAKKKAGTSFENV